MVERVHSFTDNNKFKGREIFDYEAYNFQPTLLLDLYW